MDIVETARLSAINYILGSIGEAPVNSLDDTTNIDAVNAQRILDEVDKEVQQQGWTFNSYDAFKFLPDSFSKKIKWNNNILSMRTPTYIKRGKYFYDKERQSDSFDSPIEVKVIMKEEFGDLPDVFQRYITAKAAREFQIAYLGVPELVQMALQKEQEAWQAIVQYDLDTGGYNMLENTAISTNLQRSL